MQQELTYKEMRQPPLKGAQAMYKSSFFLSEDLLPYEKIMPVEEILHEDEFTGRVEELRELEDWIKQIGRVGAGSTSIIAPRRMGKTVLLDRLVNIIFFKPEYKVAPFYIKFKREEITLRKFLLLYATEFFRQYIAYCLQDPALYSETSISVEDLLEIDSEDIAIKIAQQQIMYFLKRYNKDDYEDARNHWDDFIKVPEKIASRSGTRVAIIIDEFQDMKFYVYDQDEITLAEFKELNQGKPSYRAVDLTATYDRQSLSKKAPMLVSGSAVTLIFKTVMGGPLGGRFGFKYLKPLSLTDGATLIKNLVKIYTPNLTIDLDRAMYASEEVNGHPYYLYCIVTSDYNNKVFTDEEQIDNILSYEIEYGKIYGFWQTHFEENREYINSDNDKEIGKKIIYYFTKYSNKEVDIVEIAKNIGISKVEVEKKIEKLYYADIVHKTANRYFGFKDICLMRYIKHVYANDLEGMPHIDLSESGKMNFIKGKYLELFVANTMNKFNNEKITLGHGNSTKTIEAPIMRTTIGYQFKADTSQAFEIDILGNLKNIGDIMRVWLCECKYRKVKMGLADIKRLEDLQQTYIKYVGTQHRKPPKMEIKRWYISTGGFTKEALAYLKKKEDVYYSDYENVNALCLQYGSGYNLPRFKETDTYKVIKDK